VDKQSLLVRCLFNFLYLPPKSYSLLIDFLVTCCMLVCYSANVRLQHLLIKYCELLLLLSYCVTFMRP